MAVTSFLHTWAIRLKVRWNCRARLRGQYHNRVCMGATFCIRWMVYDGCCWKHQDAYDRRAAKRLKRSRNLIARRSRRRQRRQQLNLYRHHLIGRY